VHEERHVVGPLAYEVCVLNGARDGAQHSEGLVADLPAVAVGAVQEVATDRGAGLLRPLRFLRVLPRTVVT